MKKKSIIIVIIIILLLCVIGGAIWFINSNKETEDVANTDVVPTAVPTEAPTEVPTPEPTEVPTPEPTEVPTPEPTEAPVEEEVETPDFEDLNDEDKANVNRNDSDSVDGLPEVKDPEDELETPVEDEPTTPSNQRNNTIPEEDIPFYLEKIGISRAEFDKLTNKQAEDMLYRALVNEATGGGTPGGNTGGNTGGGTSGGNTTPDVGNGGDDDLPTAPMNPGTVEGQM